MAQIREKRSYRGVCAGEMYSGRVTNETKGRLCVGNDRHGAARFA